ncbi:hypothetical protein C922_02806 [Plasmodium inui San Antonio 1]|uniref:6-Cys domain-containing protein n=1 Tax=Plasmodium inui San Antonio 1 TaxID=1237626 RepID=W7ANC8_9APIC|nr:hypothetical protein C922_02806 [Plasmodium inui San Antonio 1]EUD66821.1 hypothetical protein C922_02806 [Plasmodium inui San Antonio 1]
MGKLAKLKRLLLLLPLVQIILAQNNDGRAGVTSKGRVHSSGWVTDGKGDEGRCVRRNADPYVLGRDPFGGITKGRFSPKGVHYGERNDSNENHSLLLLLKSQDRRRGVKGYYLGRFPLGEDSAIREYKPSGAIKMVTNHLHSQAKFWNNDIVIIAHELFGVSPMGKLSTRRVARHLAEDDDNDDEEDDGEDDGEDDSEDDGEDDSENGGDDDDDGEEEQQEEEQQDDNEEAAEEEEEKDENAAGEEDPYQSKSSLKGEDEDYQIKGMDLEEDLAPEDDESLVFDVSDASDETFDKVEEGFEGTIKGNDEKLKEADEDVETFQSSSTNKEYVCDFQARLSPKESPKKAVICEMKIQEPLVKVKIVCPTKSSDGDKYASMEYFPKKAPYVTLVNKNEDSETEKDLLKEKKLAVLIHGVIIPPKVSEKENELEKGAIEFILPPVFKQRKKIYYICDNSKSVEDSDKKGGRGVVSISIEPYGQSVKGCNYTGKKKHFFTYDYEKDKDMKHPCVFHVSAGEIGGIRFPKGTKSTTCFDQMIAHSSNQQLDKGKKSLSEIIDSAVVYNKDFEAKYFKIKYFSIPSSFRDKIHLFCHIHLEEGDKKHMVYISINQEINLSVFDLYESFSNVKKVIQVPEKTEGKKEYTCDFKDKLDKTADPNEKKVIICRKRLTEFDTFHMKCPMKKGNYEKLEMIPKTLKQETETKNINVLKVQLEVQYQLFKKYLQFHDKYGTYLPDYPSLLNFPLNRVAKLELKKNSIFKNHKDSSYFDEVPLPSEGLVKLLAYLDAQEIVVLRKQIPNLDISEDQSEGNFFDLKVQIPPYIDTDEPLYVLMGCNNTNDEGNLGIVELVLSKSEHIVKGCNFSSLKIDHFTNNVGSTEQTCDITAYPNDIVGFNCSKTNVPESDQEDSSDDPNVVIEPEGCFTEVYNKSHEKKDITTILPGALVYSNGKKKKSRSFIKIPTVPVKDKLEFYCKCKIDNVVNSMNVKVLGDRDNEKTAIVAEKKKAIITEKGNEEDGKIYMCPNKTLIEPKLEKLDDRYVKNICEVEVKEIDSYVELYCPSKDFSIHRDISLNYTTVTPTKEDTEKTLNQEALDKIIPHAEILHNTRSILPLKSTTNDKEKVDLSHVYLFFPYYVKEEHKFNIICDNSKTFFEQKRGSSLTYEITVPQRSKKVKGCDFTTPNTSEIFLNKPTENNCSVDAVPKDVIGFVCPPDSVKITSCFKDAVVNDNLTNISEMLHLKNNIANYTHKHKFNYIQIPSVITEDFSFKCICVNLQKDYQLKSPPSDKLLDVIYQKIDIKKGDSYTRGDAKNKFLMSGLDLYLAHKKNKLMSIFQKVDEKKPYEDEANPEEIIQEIANAETYDDGMASTCSLSQIIDNYISGDDYSVYTNVSDDSLEETIMKEISALDKSHFKLYTLTVNFKASKLIEPKKLKDNQYVCDFSKKILLLPEPLSEESPPELHCNVALKPLDTLYVKCPTVKETYATAKGKTAEKDDDEDKGIITILEDAATGADLASSSPMDDPSFVKYFDSVSMKPSEFFKKVLKDDDQEEEEIDKILPGVVYTSLKVLKKSDPFTSYAALIVPPTISRSEFFKVECNNSAYKDGAKNGGYKGIIHLNISKSEKKTIGCDFTSAGSTILSKGIDLPTGQETKCEVEVTKNEIFGIRCSDDYTFDPVKCFHEVHDKTEKSKKIEELIPDVQVFSLPNSKTKVSYGKIPLDYVNKINFSCSCNKSDDNTKGTMNVVVNKDEVELENMKMTDAVKHGQVNFCNFFDDDELVFKKNPDKTVQCKVDAELFSEVVVILPNIGSGRLDRDYTNFSTTPQLDEGKDIKVIDDEKGEVSLTSALKGVYGNRVFSFEKNSKKGIGFSFFIPPTFENKHFKIVIKESKLLATEKQRGIIFIIVRKNVEPGSLKMCDFTSSEYSLAQLDAKNNEKVCNVKITKGDIFGITCPKGFYLYPEACFSNVTLDYYKGELHVEDEEKEGNDEEINFSEKTKTNMRLKDLLHLIGDDDTKMADLQKYSEFSNITEMLNFETFHLGSMHLDYQNNYTSSYAKVPMKFRSAIKFSCSCYSPTKKVFGSMDIETEYASSEGEPKIREDPFVQNKLLPLRNKISIDADEVEPIEEIDTMEDSEAADLEGCKEDGTCSSNLLSQGISYTCDFSQDSLFTPIEGKIQKNTCTVDAQALDVVTIKCPAIPDHVHKEDAVSEEEETEKVTITIGEEEFVTYPEEKTKKKTFSLKEIYDREYYGMTSEEVINMRKLEAGWDKKQVYYPKRVLDHVIVANKVTKLEDVLPGVLHLQSKVNDELKTTDLIKDGVVRFLIPPYVKNDFQFHLFCGKSSEEKPKGKNTSLGMIHINVSANRRELQGCDFINDKEEDPDSVILINKQEESDDHMCNISLIPNTVVGINCPSEKLHPENCFHETYFISDSEEASVGRDDIDQTKEQITNVIKGAIPVSNFSNKKNTYTYLILPKDMKDLETLEKNFYCMCDRDVIKMKIDKIYLKKEKESRVENGTCSYDSVKDVTTCNVVELMESLQDKDNTTYHNQLNLSRWDKLILKYPTNEKKDYEKIFVNPINIKDKVLFKRIPTPIEELLPGAITTNKLNSVTKTIEHTLRVPPYVSKEVNFSLEFNNSLTSKTVNGNVTYGGIVKIFIRVHEGYNEISGCDFSGMYKDLFSHNFDPNLKESKTCSVTFGNNSYAGFACPRKFHVLPQNCFESVYDNTDKMKEKKLVDLSEKAEFDFVQYNARGVSLSYVTFKQDTKGHNISCKCVSTEVTHIINVIFQPDVDHSLPKTRIRIRYVDLSKATFSSHLRGR